MKKPRFVIVSPKAMCGGVIVLHELCRELNRQGYSSKMFYIDESIYSGKVKYWLNWLNYTKKELFRKKDRRYGKANSLGGCKTKWFPVVRKKTIVVYPEVVYGNILRAKRVVRWLLSYNRYKDDPKAYDKDDMFVCYRIQFNDDHLNPSKNSLYVSYFNLELYKRTNYGERSGKCFIIYKGKDRDDLPKEYDGIVVDNLSDTEKVKVFNKCEYCICYDMQTGYQIVAALCGCIVILVPENGKTLDDYRNKDDIRFYGVAFGDSENEIAFAKNTIDDAKKQIESEMRKGKESVKKFVVYCINYFDRLQR